MKFLSIAELDRSIDDFLKLYPKHENIHLFSYGSLMYAPRFEYTQKLRARLKRYHRSLCIKSYVHRGTQTSPGLVFGLEDGGHCDGIVYTLKQNDRVGLRDIWQRESMFHADSPKKLSDVYYIDGDKKLPFPVFAFTRHQSVFRHWHYQDLDHQKKVEILKRASGNKGLNIDYVYDAWRFMKKNKLSDFELEIIVLAVENRRSLNVDVWETITRYDFDAVSDVKLMFPDLTNQPRYEKSPEMSVVEFSLQNELGATIRPAVQEY